MNLELAKDGLPFVMLTVILSTSPHFGVCERAKYSPRNAEAHYFQRFLEIFLLLLPAFMATGVDLSIKRLMLGVDVHAQ